MSVEKLAIEMSESFKKTIAIKRKNVYNRFNKVASEGEIDLAIDLLIEDVTWKKNKQVIVPYAKGKI